jgi:uncharacterized protein DUF4136
MRQQQVLNSITKALLIALAVVVAACASSLRVRTDYDRSANFKQYRTFAIREGNSSGNPVMDQRIREDITAALKAKGLDEVRPENADVVVVSHTATRTQRTYETCAKTAVWHGFASGVLSDEPSKNADKADKAVQKLISEYPA